MIAGIPINTATEDTAILLGGSIVATLAAGVEGWIILKAQMSAKEAVEEANEAYAAISASVSAAKIHELNRYSLKFQTLKWWNNYFDRSLECWKEAKLFIFGKWVDCC